MAAKRYNGGKRPSVKDSKVLAGQLIEVKDPVAPISRAPRSPARRTEPALKPDDFKTDARVKKHLGSLMAMCSANDGAAIVIPWFCKDGSFYTKVRKP